MIMDVTDEAILKTINYFEFKSLQRSSHNSSQDLI